MTRRDAERWMAAMAGCLLLAGCAAPPQATGGEPPDVVTIDNFSFLPATKTVSVGERVTWVNKDDVPHTVTSSGDPRVMDSAAMDTDGRYSAVFTAAGTYPYFCKVHPHMTGVVVVK